MKDLILSHGVTTLKGIGDKKAQLLYKLGISTIEDLIHFYPRRYERQTPIVSIAEVVVGQTNTISGQIHQSGFNVRRRQLIMTQTVLRDETGQIAIVWFNQPYLAKTLEVGKPLILKGQVTMKQGRLVLSSPKVLKEEDKELDEDVQFLPIYPMTLGLHQKQVRELIGQLVERVKPLLKEHLPQWALSEYQLLGYEESLMQIHLPQDDKSLEAARRRLIFDEFLFFQLGLRQMKQFATRLENQCPVIVMEKTHRLKEQLPFTLTQSQEEVLREILSDISGPYVMNRLIQGDVGSGKTIVAALALLAVIENGYQGVLMAPTEVLAKQHLESLEKIFQPLGIRVGLLVGSMGLKDKREVKSSLAAGDIQLLIGTHAVIQEGVDFSALGLVITDEQHRFGVKQREQIAKKGNMPHVLVMSATPIPRTLALILYGDMDVSLMKDMPVGRLAIETYHVTTAYMARLYAFIEKEVAAGRQCYVVTPMVEEQETLDVANVISLTETLQTHLSPEVKTAYLHGQMKAKEKDDIMALFSKGEIHVLVATTVIEVGVNVPNATLMIIMNAERFGLAQLHQLRGRVGRSHHQSYCVLVSDAKNQVTKKRLEVMTTSTDGFVIAEEDLKLRGHGDLLGIKQSGLPTFRIANVLEDVEILKQAHHFVTQVERVQENEEAFKALEEKMERFMENSMTFIAL